MFTQSHNWWSTLSCVTTHMILLWYIEKCGKHNYFTIKGQSYELRCAPNTFSLSLSSPSPSNNDIEHA